jgi:drug/metabolite transporter (DMT)-like permease
MGPLDTTSLAIFTVMLACGQVMFKRVGLTLRDHNGSGVIWLILREPSLYLALAIYGAATLLWIWILSRVSLVQAYPWVAIGMIIVPGLGWLVFGERVTPTFWLGAAFIVFGIGLTQYGSGAAVMAHDRSEAAQADRHDND